MQSPSSSTKGSATLLVASVFFGSSAILIRYATEATAISLTFFRLLIAALLIVLLAVSGHNLKSLGKRDLLLVLFSGSLLSLHFATFIFAVQATTVANATFLVNTSPIMLAILSPLVLSERTTSREVIAVIAATLGILIVANAGNGFSAFGLGDLSALLAAFLFAVYSLVGRHLRTAGVNTVCYTSYVYTTATAVSLIMVGFSPAQTFRPYDLQNILAILGLGVVPTALGHTLYNHALGSVKAVTANVFPLLEPVIASIFAVVLFAEIPTLFQVAGYSLIFVAVAIVAASMPSAAR
jgi:drug/metabolite transporter (DMT)-like permease